MSQKFALESMVNKPASEAEVFKAFESFLQDKEATNGYEQWLDEACNVEAGQREAALAHFKAEEVRKADMKDSQNFIMTRTLRHKNVLDVDQFVTDYTLGFGKLFVEVNYGYELVMDHNYNIIKVNSLTGEKK